MNWRAGFKRVEIAYVIVAVLFTVMSALSSGGGFDKLTRPVDDYRVRDLNTGELEDLYFPHGTPLPTVRSALIRDRAIRPTDILDAPYTDLFDWDAARSAGASVAFGFGFFWLLAKVALWIVRGFRAKA